MKSVLAFIFILFVFTSGAQTAKLSTDDLLIEGVQEDRQDGSKQIVIWLPYKFWQLVGEQIQAPQEIVQELIGQMKGYTMFFVADYRPGSDIPFRSDKDIRSTLRLTDSSNKILRPLAESEVLPDVRTLLQKLRPKLATKLGELGEGMRLYLFKAEMVNGEPALDVTRANRFTLSWDDVKMTWKLPLAVVLPSKKCPVDNEPMKGNWNYCPEHGVKLDN
jgi:hypothetical protein